MLVTFHLFWSRFAQNFISNYLGPKFRPLRRPRRAAAADIFEAPPPPIFVGRRAAAAAADN